MAAQRKNDHDVVTLATVTAGAAQVATTSTAVRLSAPLNAVVLQLDVTTAAADVDDTLDLKVQTKIDGTNWVDVCYFTQVLGNGGAKRHIGKILGQTAQAMFADAALTAGNVRHLFGDEWRVIYTIVDPSGANAAFTFTVKALVM